MSPHVDSLHVRQSAHRVVPCHLMHMQSEAAATSPVKEIHFNLNSRVTVTSTLSSVEAVGLHPILTRALNISNKLR